MRMSITSSVNKMDLRSSAKKDTTTSNESAGSLESIKSEPGDATETVFTKPRQLPAVDDFVISNTQEVVKINLTGLGDTQVGSNIAILDRQNKFLVAPDDGDSQSSDDEMIFARHPSRSGGMYGETSCGDGLHGERMDEVSKLHSLLEQKLKTVKEKRVDQKRTDDAKQSDSPWRVIEVKSAAITHDSTRLPPTLVIKSIEEEDAKDKAERERCFRRAYGRAVYDQEEQENEVNLCLEGKSVNKKEGNNKSAGTKAPSSSNTRDLDFEPGYVVIQGEFNTLTRNPHVNSSNNGSTQIGMYSSASKKEICRKRICAEEKAAKELHSRSEGSINIARRRRDVICAPVLTRLPNNGKRRTVGY